MPSAAFGGFQRSKTRENTTTAATQPLKYVVTTGFQTWRASMVNFFRRRSSNWCRVAGCGDDTSATGATPYMLFQGFGGEVKKTNCNRPGILDALERQDATFTFRLSVEDVSHHQHLLSTKLLESSGLETSYQGISIFRV
jgi:hypothetical protein